MNIFKSSRSYRMATAIPWLAGPLLFGVLALLLGQDANWDLRNYHFYNAFSFLTDRLDYDVAPGQVANYYNPLLYVPFYFLVASLPPMAVAFLLGAAQGLNFPLLVGLARGVLGERKTAPWWPVYAIALLGVLGAGNISEVGTMFADNLVSLPVLGGIWLLTAKYRLLTDSNSGKSFLLAAGSGLLFGIAAGLKQPAVIFALGWCAAFLVLPVPSWRRISLAFVFGLGVLTGFAVTGGWWMYELWSRYGNPLFPYFNHLFASPMASIGDYRDTRFLPGSIWDALIFPFTIFYEPLRAGEVFFRDVRFVLFTILLGAVGLYFLFERGRQGSDPPENPIVSADSSPRKMLFLLCGALIAYTAWLKMFAIYRYLLVLEMLAPLGIWLLIASFPLRNAIKHYAALACAVLLLVTLKPGNWGRTAWGDDYFGVRPPALAEPANTLVVMTGVSPLSYVIPFFPASVRFLRIDSYFTGPSDSPNGSDLRMRQLVAGHHGPIYVLASANEEERATNALRAYGLRIAGGECLQMKSRIEESLESSLLFCAVSRLEYSSNTRGEADDPS